MYVHIIVTTYITLARQFWWHRRKQKLNILLWILGIIEYLLAILGSLIFMLIYPRRSIVIFGIFNWMRSVDDIIDGDDPKSANIELDQYIANKHEVINSIVGTDNNDIDDLAISIDRFDRDLSFACLKADRFDQDQIVRKNISTIFDLMVEEKTLCIRPISSDVLKKFATDQDTAIAKLACFLMGGNLEKLSGLWKNGIFTRIDWLYDIRDDLKRGLIHISGEILLKNNCDINTASIEIKKSKKNNNQIPQCLFACLSEEIKIIRTEWDLILQNRQKYKAGFKNIFMRLIFDHLAIGSFDRKLKRLENLYR